MPGLDEEPGVVTGVTVATEGYKYYQIRDIMCGGKKSGILKGGRKIRIRSKIGRGERKKKGGKRGK